MAIQVLRPDWIRYSTSDTQKSLHSCRADDAAAGGLPPSSPVSRTVFYSPLSFYFDFYFYFILSIATLSAHYPHTIRTLSTHYLYSLATKKPQRSTIGQPKEHYSSTARPCSLQQEEYNGNEANEDESDARLVRCQCHILVSYLLKYGFKGTKIILFMLRYGRKSS